MKEANNQKKCAEDILCDDALSEQLISGEAGGSEIPEEELLFARELLRAIGPEKSRLSVGQKDLLDQRIVDTISRSKRNKVLAWMGSAAALLFIVGLTFFFKSQNQSEIVDFATSDLVEPNSGFTQLKLSGEKVIKIEAPESKIAYSKSGNEIKIDAHDPVGQTVNNESVAYNTIVVPYGKRSRVTLSDNTTIWLNSGSKLVYPVRFAENKREVYLDGEALFEVAPDKNHPFHVLTRGMEVKVLGTVFNLSAFAEDNTINTVLEHGSVELIYKQRFLRGSSRERMVPGMLAVYNLADKTLVQQSVNTKDFTSWKDGYLALEKKSLGSIAKKLSRYYNVTIEFDDRKLAEETFSGYLDLRNSAMQVLSMIGEMMDIEVVQSDRVIKIRKKQSPV